MIISRTPFRISFFGGGTDFPGVYRGHGGAVLSTTINQYCYISVHRLSPFFKYRFKANYAKTECVKHPREFEHPLIRESFILLRIREGIELSHVADHVCRGIDGSVVPPRRWARPSTSSRPPPRASSIVIRCASTSGATTSFRPVARGAIW